MYTCIKNKYPLPKETTNFLQEDISTNTLSHIPQTCTTETGTIPIKRLHTTCNYKTSIGNTQVHVHLQYVEFLWTCVFLPVYITRGIIYQGPSVENT